MSKFKIPSINELDKDEDKIKASSLFQAHKSPPKVVHIPTPSSSSTGTVVSKPVTQTVVEQTKCTENSLPSLTPTASSSAGVLQGSASSSAPEVSSSSAGTTLRTGIPGKSNNLIVSRRQRGNPILKHVRNVAWEFGDIVPDYQLGQTSCALFLSLRYHALNPTYIYERLKQLGYSYDLRVLLVQVDVKDSHHSLKDLAKMCLLSDCTMILAWSAEEAGRYLETYKAFEEKPPDLIMEKLDANYAGRITDVLTTVKKVNKSDAATLMNYFQTLDKIVSLDEEGLSLCPGFGPQKAKRLYDVFHEPFLKPKKKKQQNADAPSTSTKEANVKAKKR